MLLHILKRARSTEATAGPLTVALEGFDERVVLRVRRIDVSGAADFVETTWSCPADETSAGRLFPPGRYVVQLLCESGWRALKGPLELFPGEPAEVRFDRPELATLSIQVRDLVGAPIAGALVRTALIGPESMLSRGYGAFAHADWFGLQAPWEVDAVRVSTGLAETARALTDTAGTCALPAAVGTITHVLVQAAGYATWIEPGLLVRPGGTSLEVMLGEGLKSIPVRVLLPDGRPAAGAWVSTFDPRLPWGGPSDAWPPVPVGERRSATPFPERREHVVFDPPTEEVTLYALLPGRGLASAVGRAGVPLEIRLGPTISVPVVVRTSVGDTPIPSASLRAFVRGPLPVPLVIERDGEGRFLVHGVPRDAALRLGAWAPGYADALAYADVETWAGGHALALDLRAGVEASLEVRAGEHQPSVMVSLSPPRPDGPSAPVFARNVRRGADGAWFFSFDGLAPGQYRVVVQAEGYEQREHAWEVGAEAAEVPVLTLQARPTELLVRVVDPANEPVLGALVRAFRCEARTDAHGEARLRLPPEPVDIFAWAPGLGDAHASSTEGMDGRVTLRLTPSGRLDVRAEERIEAAVTLLLLRPPQGKTAARAFGAEAAFTGLAAGTYQVLVECAGQMRLLEPVEIARGRTVLRYRLDDTDD